MNVAGPLFVGLMKMFMLRHNFDRAEIVNLRTLFEHFFVVVLFPVVVLLICSEFW